MTEEKEQPKIIGWEGCCFVPGEGKVDSSGRMTIMVVHSDQMRSTPEEAWLNAVALGIEHNCEYRAIKPVLEDQPQKKRKVLTLVVYEN